MAQGDHIWQQCFIWKTGLREVQLGQIGQKIVFNLELADLAVEFGHLGLMMDLLFLPLAEQVRDVFNESCFQRLCVRTKIFLRVDRCKYSITCKFLLKLLHLTSDESLFERIFHAGQRPANGYCRAGHIAGKYKKARIFLYVHK